MKLGRDFDLKKFTGSFSRVADFSAWYPSGKAAEYAAADEDARGSIQVLHVFFQHDAGGRLPQAHWQ